MEIRRRYGHENSVESEYDISRVSQSKMRFESETCRVKGAEGLAYQQCCTAIAQARVQLKAMINCGRYPVLGLLYRSPQLQVAANPLL